MGHDGPWWAFKWDNYRSKCGVFQQTMFDYRRLVKRTDECGWHAEIFSGLWGTIFGMILSLQKYQNFPNRMMSTPDEYPWAVSFGVTASVPMITIYLIYLGRASPHSRTRVHWLPWLARHWCLRALQRWEGPERCVCHLLSCQRPGCSWKSWKAVGMTWTVDKTW